jgi:hypothetical protein
MKPGDVKAVPSSLGVHVLRVDDVFQTLNIDSQPRTRGLPGSGHRPTPLIELLRQGSEDSRSLLQLSAVGSTEAGQGTGAASELMLNSGKTAGKTMRYSMESMGYALTPNLTLSLTLSLTVANRTPKPKPNTTSLTLSLSLPLNQVPDEHRGRGADGGPAAGHRFREGGRSQGRAGPAVLTLTLTLT